MIQLKINLKLKAMKDKQDFALQLEGCSKADRKKCQKLHDSLGGEWADEDRFKTEKFDYLIFNNNPDNNTRFYSNKGYELPLYQMPQDCSKIQEALGIDEPKDGEVYVFGNDGDWMHRIKNWDINNNSGYAYNITSDTNLTFCSYFITTKRRIANEEEVEQRILNEHKNGYHWDGKELVKIPEYVYSICTSKIANIYIDDFGRIREVDYWGNTFGFEYVCDNQSTKEDYEAQEAKKLKIKIHDDLSSLESFTIEIRGLDEIAQLKERITELEAENLGFKKLLEKREKEIEDYKRILDNIASNFSH